MHTLPSDGMVWCFLMGHSSMALAYGVLFLFLAGIPLLFFYHSFLALEVEVCFYSGSLDQFQNSKFSFACHVTYYLASVHLVRQAIYHALMFVLGLGSPHDCRDRELWGIRQCSAEMWGLFAGISCGDRNEKL